MQTQVLKSEPAAIARAAELLAAGQLVAFPTETVYGLGANALDPLAVLSIFQAKGRPADNPLIVHIHDRAQLDGLAEMPPLAAPLMDAFWPGPLTMLMRRKPAIPDQVTAGLPTVAIRMPSHPVALAMLRACDLPIAAPSANRSGRPSPTTAAHVLQDMEGRIPLILDGGPCAVGVESTVLDLSGDVPCILRPGGVTREMLQQVLKLPVTVAGSVLRPLQEGERALSPGMRYQHYAPRGKVTLVEGEEAEVLKALRLLQHQAASGGKKSCVLCFSQHMDALADCQPHDMGSLQDASSVAQRLFDTLRRLDEEGQELIFSEVLPPQGVGLAVMNRLGRASAFRSVRAEQVLASAQRDSHA